MAGVMAAHGLATRSGQRRSRRPRRVFRDNTVTRLLCAFAVLAVLASSRREGDISASGGATPRPSSSNVPSFATEPARFTRAT